MHTQLAAVLSSDLDQPTKLAYSCMYANTNGTGQASMPVADVLALLRIRNAGTLREIRQRLKQAGYIDSYIADGVLHWSLIGARPTAALDDEERGPQPRSDDASAADSRADTDEARPTAALEDEERGCGPRIDDESAAHSRADTDGARPRAAQTRPTAAVDDTHVCLLVNNPINNQDTNKQTPPAREAADAARTYRLLRDPEVNISDALARAWAGQHQFAWILGQVLSWQHQLASGKVHGTGALINRVNKKYSIDEITPDDQASPLYRRHVGDPNDNARLIELYSHDRPDVGPLPAPDEETPAAALWRRTLEVLKLQTTRSMYDTWLKDSHGLEADDQSITVGVPSAQHVAYLQARLKKLIDKNIAQTADREMTVCYIVQK